MEKLGELSDIDKKMMVIEPRISNNNFTFLKKHIENLTKKKPPKTCCARLDILAEFCTMYKGSFADLATLKPAAYEHGVEIFETSFVAYRKSDLHNLEDIKQATRLYVITEFLKDIHLRVGVSVGGVLNDDVKDMVYWYERFAEAEAEILPENYAMLGRHIKGVAKRRKRKTVTNHLNILIMFCIWWKKPFQELKQIKRLHWSSVKEFSCLKAIDFALEAGLKLGLFT